MSESRQMKRNAIVVGASSGIGLELAKVLAANGYSVGLVARRLNLLSELARELPTRAFAKAIDVSKPIEAMPLLRELIVEMNNVELFVIGAGTGSINPELDWERERETIDLNVSGFAAIINVAVEHLQARGSGHIVGISSLAALRGIGAAPAYNASKAFMSNYLQGLRQRFRKLKLPVVVTDVPEGAMTLSNTKVLYGSTNGTYAGGGGIYTNTASVTLTNGSAGGSHSTWARSARWRRS